MVSLCRTNYFGVCDLLHWMHTFAVWFARLTGLFYHKNINNNFDGRANASRCAHTTIGVRKEWTDDGDRWWWAQLTKLLPFSWLICLIEFDTATPFQPVQTNECFGELNLARANAIHRHNTNVIINFKCFDCFVAVAIICRLLHIRSVETLFLFCDTLLRLFFTICRSKHNFPAPL